jgi:hypothetical protein
MKTVMAALAALSAFCVASAAHAQGTHHSKIGQAAVELVTRGHATAGDGKAVWKRDGTYVFTSNKGETWKGIWRVVGDQICVQYTTGYSRCDEIRKLGNHWVLVTQWGEHYPLH